MQYRTLGKTGWNVSAVSMGCWAIGGQWGKVSELQAIETVHEAYDAGVNFFDTADAYGQGRSEELLGVAIKGKRHRLYVATKVGNWGRRDSDPLAYKTIHSIINCCHASLHRLDIETIDLYQCHVGNPEHPEIFIEAFEKLQKAGKIRHYAISTNSLKGLKELNATGECMSCQLNYSILNRTAEKDILPYCRENNIGVLVRGPIGQGLLADKFTPESRFEDMVRLKWNPDGEQHKQFLNHLEVVKKLRPLVKQGESMVDLALRFTLAHPAVTCPIPGMKNPAQALANIEAQTGELSAEVLKKIDAIVAPGTGSQP